MLLLLLVQGDIIMAQNVTKIDRDEAWQLVLKQIFNGQSEGKIIYAQQELIVKRQKLEEIREIYTPKSTSWFFFVDLMPYQSWGHPCQYIFVDSKTGEIKSIKSDFPPDLGEMDIIYIEKMPKKGKLFKFKPFQKSIRTVSTSNDYAVIISGGMDKYNNYERFWNDCSAIYSVLVDVYGYLDDHIYVLLADGTNPALDRRIGSNSYDSSPLDLDEDGDDDVQYAATKDNIQQVFTILGGKLSRDDHLFVFTTDHGGLESGNNVFINLWNETMRDDEFATELSKVNAGRFNIIMEQCHSGGFIDDLTAENRIIATACRADENSFARGAFTYNEFVYHWISAIAGITPEGTAVDADSNNDGWISMEEAFIYAESNDEQNEHPQYDSNPEYLGCMTSLDPNIWSLNGSDFVCSSESIYELSDLPSGTSVTWTSSSNISFPDGNTGEKVMAKAYSSASTGAGWIEATISSTCGDVTLPRKDVWVGTPSEIEITCPLLAVELNSKVYISASKIGLSEEDNSKQLADTQVNFEFENAINSVAIYPNPVEDIVNVQIPGNLIVDNNCSIEIYNSTGKLLLKKKVTSTINSIDLSNSPSGIYIVKLLTNQEIITKKIIKK